MSSQLVAVQGLPVDDLSSAPDVNGQVLSSGEGGSERDLDIGSATRGNRVVSTSQV